MIAIVGHGPSMLENEYGEEIDSHDKVIRQKRCEETLKLPKQYGTRTDIVCGSYTIGNLLPRSMPGCEYWVFMDSRHEKVPGFAVMKTKEEVPCKISRHICDKWNDVYRSMRTPYELPKNVQRFTDLGHPHMSAGLHTLIYALEFIPDKPITLYGYDNVKSGGFTWSVTRGPEWDKYPDHHWPVEHAMVDLLRDHYKREVVFR